MTLPQCPSCGKALEAGVSKDQGHGAVYPVAWISGPAERSFWGGIKLRHRTRLAVHALRGTGCGLVHLHAPGDPPAA